MLNTPLTRKKKMDGQGLPHLRMVEGQMDMDRPLGRDGKYADS